MTYFTIPGDCIDRVTPQDGDRVLFETACDTKTRTQGHVEAELESNSRSSKRATWESTAEVQDDSKHIAEADQATRKLGHTTSDMNVDTHLRLVKNEAVKEELTDTNTKAIERVKTGSK